MSTIINDYFEALERLKTNQSIRVPKGSKISNDTVALEAGRGKGSIKKSRLVYSELISAIKQAAENSNFESDCERKLCQSKDEVDKYRRLYEEGVARELALFYELHELKKEFKKLTTPK